MTHEPKLVTVALPAAPHLRPVVARPPGPLWLYFLGLFAAGVALAHLPDVTAWGPLGPILSVLRWLLLPALLVGAFAAYRRRCMVVHAELARAGDLLARRDLDAAEAAYDTIARRTTIAELHHLAVNDLGCIALLRSRPARALSLFSAAEQHQVGAAWASFRHLTACNLATAFAIAGRVEEAEAWLAEARRRPGEPSWRFQLEPAALVACRRGCFAEAARELEQGWRDAQAVLTARALRSLGVLRAFALACSAPREAGALERILGPARDCEPGEYDHLAVAWPELRAFLVTHGLSQDDGPGADPDAIAITPPRPALPRSPLAVQLCLLAVMLALAGSALKMSSEKHRVGAFCKQVHPGLTVAQAREAAARSGLEILLTSEPRSADLPGVLAVGTTWAGQAWVCGIAHDGRVVTSADLTVP